MLDPGIYSYGLQRRTRMSSDDRRAAKAEVEAAKARAKAMRPWYKRKIVIIPLALVLLVIIISSMGGGDSGDGVGSSDNAGGGSSSNVVQATIPGEATLDISGNRSTTRFTGVTTRKESIPGNEFSAAAEGKVFLTFAGEVENLGPDDLDLNASVYRLKMPTGEILDYQAYSADGDKAFTLGTTLPRGVKKAGQMSWEVPTPAQGQTYVILWKPSPFEAEQAQFTYTSP
jgi:hypothetical protein